MGSKLSQYDYSILTLKCVNLIQEKTRYYCPIILKNYLFFKEIG